MKNLFKIFAGLAGAALLAGCAATTPGDWANVALSSEMQNARYDQTCVQTKRAAPGFQFGTVNGGRDALVVFEMPGCTKGNFSRGASGMTFWVVYHNSDAGPRRVLNTIAHGVNFTSDGFTVSSRGDDCGATVLKKCTRRFALRNGVATLITQVVS